MAVHSRWDCLVYFQSLGVAAPEDLTWMDELLPLIGFIVLLVPVAGLVLLVVFIVKTSRLSRTVQGLTAEVAALKRETERLNRLISAGVGGPATASEREVKPAFWARALDTAPIESAFLREEHASSPIQPLESSATVTPPLGPEPSPDVAKPQAPGSIEPAPPEPSPIELTPIAPPSVTPPPATPPPAAPSRSIYTSPWAPAPQQTSPGPPGAT
ncbi:MAG TPA: hypothetical protein VLZ81_15035, partial [Blastocatellia bacterium]|nr:hypothetical protein [Blastocatellia bacterium]